jgi:hypothetical protein
MSVIRKETEVTLQPIPQEAFDKSGVRSPFAHLDLR